jgi:hypothetical protein
MTIDNQKANKNKTKSRAWPRLALKSLVIEISICLRASKREKLLIDPPQRPELQGYEFLIFIYIFERC